jgi:hypothetical protein
VRRSKASWYFSQVPATTSSGSSGAGVLFVPVQGLEPVADELLVEARLRAAGLVIIGGPETGGVGREHFVGEDELAVNEAELELGIGDDDAAREGVFGGAAVDGEGQIAQRAARSVPMSSAARSKLMFSSWPDCALVAGVKMGSGVGRSR